MLRFPGDAPIEAGNRSAEDHRDWLADFLEAFEGSQFALAQVWGGAEGCVKAGTAYLDAFKAAATGTPSMDITVSGGVVMEESPLIDGDYAYSYTIIDVFGREHTTDAVIMECRGGEINVYETE